MKLIPLSQGKFTQVDDEDFEWLNQWKWSYLKNRKTGYAVRGIAIRGTHNKMILMHREILNTPPDMESDHEDQNGLNNQRYNIRICTQSQNSMNRKKHSGNFTSKYKGVGWHKTVKKWRARIKVNNKMRELGYFDNEIDAAKFYDERAKEIHGEFAYLNFP